MAKKQRFWLPYFFFFVLLALILGAGFFLLPPILETKYSRATAEEFFHFEPAVPEKIVFKASHVGTPAPVKGIYMTSWVAGDKKWRDGLVRLVDTTELNSIVIDIKDYTGNISYAVEDPYLREIGSYETRIEDVKEFIEELHRKNIYVVGRVSVFQDPMLVAKRPDLAVKKASATSTIWRDYKGITWLDAGAEEVWRYAVAIAEEAYSFGFDEINFDYIRFPSDGNMRDIFYPVSEGKVKKDVLEDFFKYVYAELEPTEIVTSVDLFGMTTTNTDDLNIGQVLEKALPYFDYVSPMVYPSHYPKSFMGLASPATKPYEVIKYSMTRAVARAKIASSSPMKLRPWLQDFNLGATYTADMVRAEMQATYDSGLDSWLLWSAANRYTAGALLGE